MKSAIRKYKFIVKSSVLMKYAYVLTNKFRIYQDFFVLSTVGVGTNEFGKVHIFKNFIEDVKSIENLSYYV